MTPETEAHLRTVLTKLLGNVPVQVEWVDNIPLTQQGKRVHVVREQAAG
jgi:acyl-coenzyme A synthetase/AMP-(fatty) acid ligase